jgi:hypothetical protein
MMETQFLIDAKVESESIPSLISLAGEGVLSPKYAKVIFGKKGSELYTEILEIQKEEGEVLEDLRKYSENYWGRIEEKYFEYMEKLTYQKLDPKKRVYFSPIIKIGIADVRGRENVFIGTYFNKEDLNYIIPHESTPLHYTDIASKIKLHEATRSPLMEGVDHMIIFKSPITKILNMKADYKKLNFVRSNPEFMKELEDEWDNRKNFESFLKKAIEIQNKFKNVKIC